ncbi:MAG: phosphoenolpyruvate--protein phosphotransferase, partial [Spirochaetota bacterium]|nr:phosphoenolpyruvate--protein phosphotransferase [Spirochaetota bacterium]
MKVYHGISASIGIAIGEAFIYDQHLHIPNYSISERQVEFEVHRFFIAMAKTKEEYILIQKKLVQEMSEDQARMLDAHIMMVDDAFLIDKICTTLRSEKRNIESVVYDVINEQCQELAKSSESFFHERIIDIYDIGQKILQNLLSQKNVSLSNIARDVIVIASELSVSDTANMNKKHVLGFVTEFGGKTSHSAILAKSLSMPAIFGLSNIVHEVSSGTLCIIDSENGIFIQNPDEKTLKEYQAKKLAEDVKKEDTLQLSRIPTVTKDGFSIPLKANMEIPEQEIDNVKKYGAEGVGLYRSEFLYFSKKRKSLPTEEQQFLAYKFILERLSDKEVTIRTLDLGGDKIIETYTTKEANPNMGWRAIRLCLENPEIFKTQLRALYRASIHGNLRIMLPMISVVEEVIQAKKLIEEVKADLKKEKIPFVKDVPLGIMIETPAAVLISDALAKHVDFFSIGSNDLIQYVMACDRGNEKISNLYQPLHPAILQLISITIKNAHKNKITCSLCGEMGSDLNNALILVGLGIDEISLSTGKLLEIRKLLQNINKKDLEVLAEQA